MSLIRDNEYKLKLKKWLLGYFDEVNCVRYLD